MRVDALDKKWFPQVIGEHQSFSPEWSSKMWANWSTRLQFFLHWVSLVKFFLVSHHLLGSLYNAARLSPTYRCSGECTHYAPRSTATSRITWLSLSKDTSAHKRPPCIAVSRNSTSKKLDLESSSELGILFDPLKSLYYFQLVFFWLLHTPPAFPHLPT